MEGSNPNNLMFKSPRTIVVNKFEKGEILKMRKNPRFMSQSLIFKTPKAEYNRTLAVSPSIQNKLSTEFRGLNTEFRGLNTGEVSKAKLHSRVNNSLEKNVSKPLLIQNEILS